MDKVNRPASLRETAGDDSRTERLSGRRAWAIILLGWLIAAVIAYWPVISGRYSLTPMNMAYSFPPWKSQQVNIAGPLFSDPVDQLLPYFYQTYYGEGYSAWNGHIGVGLPVGIEVLINPFNWFYRLPLRQAYLLKSLFKFSLAYFGMCWFLRRMKLRWTAVALGAVSYAFSSAMLMWHFWPHTDVMALAPTALGLAHALIHERRPRDILLLGIVIYMLVVAEMPSYGAYVLYLMGFYVFFSALAEHRRDVKRLFCVYAKFGGAVALGIVASLPYLRSLFSSVLDNGYAYSSMRLSLARVTLPFAALRLFLFPYTRGGLSMHPNEITGYMGAIACVLLPFSLFGQRRKKNWFWLGALAVLFVLVFTHWLDFVFVKMPGGNTSLKIRLVGPLVLVGTIVAAINLSDLIDWHELYRSKPLFWLLLAAACAGVFLLCVKLFPEAGRMALLTAISIAVFAVAALGIVYAKGEMARKAVCILLVATASLNIGYFAKQYLPFISRDASVIPEPTDTIRYLQENSGSNRYYPMEDWVLFPEMNVFYDLDCLAAHNFTNTNRDIRTFLEAADPEVYASPTRTRGGAVENTNILRYAGVRYIVKKTDSEAATGDSEQVYVGDDGLTVFEVSDPAQRFYLSGALDTLGTPEELLESLKSVYEPNRVCVYDGEVESAASQPLTDDDRIEVEADAGDRIRLNVNATADRVLVFNDYHHENWTALVDGVPARVITANYLFNGVELKAGNHTVEFVFDTAATKKQCVLTGAILGLMLAGIVATVLYDMKKKSRRGLSR